MIIQLQLQDGNPVLINSAMVTFIQPSDDETLIAFVGGTALTVVDAFDAVAELFDGEKQAAEPC